VSLSDDQLAVLFKPINESRVQKTDGYPNLEAWDVEAHLIRIFGFDWDKEVDYGLIYEEAVTWKPQNGPEKHGWDVCYHAKCRLTIDGHAKEDVASGVAKHQPHRADAHDLALKAAVSGAEKRAAKALGNQFGLSLYNNGSLKSVVGSSLAYDGFQRRADAAAAILPGLAEAGDET
jgi:recombination DNA repair RAD52 pathway protein